jgi:hypothetical protein
MIDVEIPDSSSFPVSLALASAYRDASSPPAAPPLSVGTPVVIELTRKMLRGDSDAVACLDREPASCFHLIRMACTFDPSNADRFTEAWFQVRLSAEHAMAWSMLPHREIDIEDSTSTLKIDSGLKLHGIGFKEAEHLETNLKRIRPYIDALGLHESTPRWHFKATESRELEGSIRLALVVRSRRSKPCSAMIEFEGTVKRKKLFFTFETPAKAPKELSFLVHA